MVKEKKEIKVKEPKVEVKPNFYKGYSIKWLKKEAGEEHPDYYLVKEYEDLYGEV
jgi:hypothetical protein